MHYYSFHVSDYIHDTAHLSDDEDLAYRRLLDLYYTQEKPIPNKTHEVARRIRMGKKEVAVQTVLEEFFMYSQEHDFWFHKRCDETIAAYQAKAERNRAIGKLGGRPKANPNDNPDKTQKVSKQNPNHKPITNNQEPKNIYTSSFEEFWSIYPSKTGKGEAYKSWKRINPDKQLTETILSSVNTYKESKRVKDGFIKNPATWLNQRCWEDEVEVSVATSVFAGDI